jgi:rhodanese-related sulfurtransferase
MKSFLLSLILAFGVSGFAAEFADISKEDLTKAIAAKTVVVIDVNGSESFKAGHIPGAIDFAAKKSELATVLPADKSTLIVAYCGGPACGAWQAGAEAAAALGYTNIKHFKAGISGWKDSGATVETVH